MNRDAIKNLCLFHIADGLRQGLSHFSGMSRAALIYAGKPDDPVRVYDPHELLRGHEPRLMEIYLTSEEWRVNAPDTRNIKRSGEIYPEENLQLSGLVSFGGRTRSIFYQMWFTEHHPDMCCVGPTERWMEHAVSLLSLNFSLEDPLYISTSSYALREYSIHAVRDYIHDEMGLMFGWDTGISVFPLLDTILRISRTREEGAWPRGKLVFISPEDVSKVDFLIRFPRQERPDLKNHKHVRKLLQTVEYSDRKLVTFGKNIIGIATGAMPERRSTAEFKGDYGFITLSGNPFCSFSDGNLYSTSRSPVLVDLEESLIESPLEVGLRHDLYQIVMDIAHHAGLKRHGCTIVIDLNASPKRISGQQLENPLDLHEPEFLELAKSLAKVDGALHVGSNLHLHGFACLLDGRSVPGEDRARGARFNSALRFTSEHEDIIVVVVSSDRPVSVIKEGVELTARCEWEPMSKLSCTPPTLREWVKG
ncbi:MAG: DNA integrity scanning protein DisA nucleotide-binding domain protein [Deltaproteobacteria bacterium]|nr:DNA integrity scanning protein DisA nucleotide-binding domain protein [Deltaproteobacteria bacterium]